ncbi:MAG: hypothetical protein ACK2T5_03580 [Anaerolineales bacterium]
MYTIPKLKPDRNFYPILLPLALLLVGAFLGVFWGVKLMFISWAIAFWGYALYSLLIFIRTLNPGFIISALFQISTGLVAFSMPLVIEDPANKGLTIFLLFTELFFLVWLILLAVNRKIKWRGRDILELAAAPVDQIGNGYTPRPLAAGKTGFTRQQILDFAQFARRSLVAVSYVGKDKVVFVPVAAGRESGFILGLKSDYTDETWVAFDFEGHISVNISHRDYLEYKDSLAFDQLCESLGNLFVEFIEMHLRGDNVRILDRLDATGVSIMS